MHLLSLLVALWLHVFPAPAQGADAGNSVHRKAAAAAPSYVLSSNVSGDASSGNDPWGGT